MVDYDGRNEHSSTEESRQTSSILWDDSKSCGSTVGESEDWDFIRSSHSGFDGAHFNPQPASKKDVLKNNKAVQELTINKLKYKAISLVGREQELKTLTSCIEAASSSTDNDRSKHFVLIQGYSGVGKSSLVAAARAHVQSTIKSRLPQMAHGKFDQQRYDEPYSGIAAVFDGILANIQNGVEKDDAGYIAIQTEIRTELESEIKLLQTLIPSISELVPQPDSDVESEASGSASGSANRNFEADFERLKYSFRVLTRILSKHCSPLIFVLDDLQWSDMASLRTIDFLLSDAGNSNGLVIIGLYRSNEVDEAHPLTKTIQDLQAKANNLRFDIAKIELKSLGVECINKIIMAMLNMEDGDQAKTKGLAEICCRRTLGNPFFVIEFITMLEMEGLLSFNLGLLKWMWSEKEIEEATMSTANVVDLLQARMKKLPSDLQHLMQCAACLGSEFSVSALETIWAHSGHKDAPSSDGLGVSSLLRRLEEGNFIERSSTNTCRWLHDKIQEAALSFGLALERSFKFNIGLILYQNLEKRELENMLFEVVNLINTGQHTSNAEFATLNLRAAKKARDASAFHSAAAFANTGIRLLPNDKWEIPGDLALMLYTLGLEMEVAVGNGSKVEEYSNEVLSQNHVTLLQKLPTFLAHAHMLSSDRKYGETITYLRPIMREFGYWVPRSVMLPFHSLRILRRTVQAAKKMSSSFYEKPRLMTDANKKAEILFLDRITYASYFSNNHLMMMFSTCRMVEITLQHGVSRMSGPAFASLAMIVNGVLKDRKTAQNLAETSLLFYKVVRSRFMESQTLFLTNSHIFCWTTPMSTILTSIRRVYKLACRSGNTELSMWALHCSDTVYPFHMGKKLGPIAESTAKSVPQMEELGQKPQLWATRIRWQLVLNLIGEADDVLALDGIACNSEEYDKESGSDDHMEPAARGAEIELFLFYGEYKQAAKLALDRGDADTFFGSNLSMYDYFYRCMALYAGARLTKNRRKYSRLANQIRKMIHQWAEDGNPNVKHFDCVLEAEHAALDGKYDVSEKQYQQAIKLAARTGHMHHAALFNERFADLLKNRVGFEEDAAYHLKEAIRWYDEWGAALKVKMLKESLAT